jgi:hypothetical protein
MIPFERPDPAELAANVRFERLLCAIAGAVTALPFVLYYLAH